MAERTDAGPPGGGAAPTTDRTGTSEQRRAARGDARFDLSLSLAVAVGVMIALLATSALLAVLGRLQGLIIAVLASLFLSFAMEPVVSWLSGRGVRRGIATLGVFIVGLIAVAGFFLAMAPLVIDQMRTLVESAPAILTELSVRAERLPGGLGEEVGRYLDDLALEERRVGMIGRLGEGLLEVGTTLVGGVIQLLTMLLVTFYLVADGPRFRRTVSSFLSPPRQAEVLAIWDLAIEKTGGYVYGRVLIAIASAAFHIAVFLAIGLPYAVALGLWVGVVSSLIPVVGTYLAGALPLVVALATAPLAAVWVLVAIVAYQQVENYLIMPRITAETMSLHPAVAFLAVLAGAALLGAAGALLALPAVAVLGGVVSAASERHETVDHALLGEPERRRHRGPDDVPPGT